MQLVRLMRPPCFTVLVQGCPRLSKVDRTREWGGREAAAHRGEPDDRVPLAGEGQRPVQLLPTVELQRRVPAGRWRRGPRQQVPGQHRAGHVSLSLALQESRCSCVQPSQTRAARTGCRAACPRPPTPRQSSLRTAPPAATEARLRTATLSGGAERRRRRRRRGQRGAIGMPSLPSPTIMDVDWPAPAPESLCGLNCACLLTTTVLMASGP